MDIKGNNLKQKSISLYLEFNKWFCNYSYRYCVENIKNEMQLFETISSILYLALIIMAGYDTESGISSAALASLGG